MSRLFNISNIVKRSVVIEGPPALEHDDEEEDGEDDGAS